MKYSFKNFFENQLFSGLLIIVGMLSALIIANSSISNWYFSFIDWEISLEIHDFAFSESLKLFVNDIFMTLFFLVVGFEIKREIIGGELSEIKKAVFPAIGALGGMLFPIFIFVLINLNKPNVNAWGIPMATDIAFTLGIMLLLKNRLSNSLKVSITALAIIDDIGALLVIALFYSSKISLIYFVFILIVSASVLLLNRLKITNGIVYLISGIILWILFYKSGVHPTISGVLLAFLIPANSNVDLNKFKEVVQNRLNKFDYSFNKDITHFGHIDKNSKKTIEILSKEVSNFESPLHRHERFFQPIVSFFIIPLFAFVNSGISFKGFYFIEMLNPLALGIILGLMLGKSTGIFIFSFISSKFKIATLPEKTSWLKMYGVSWLAGIGFTMSLFIAELSIKNEHFLNISKVSIFIASILSAFIGFIIIKLFCKNNSLD